MKTPIKIFHSPDSPVWDAHRPDKAGWSTGLLKGASGQLYKL